MGTGVADGNDPAGVEVSLMVTDAVGATMMVRAASLNRLMPTVSRPSVFRSLAMVWLRWSIPIPLTSVMIREEPVRAPALKSAASMFVPPNDQYRVVPLATPVA